MAYQGNNKGSYQKKPQGASSAPKEKGRQPDFDLVAIDDEGNNVMVYNEELGREVSLKIGAVWLGKGPDSPAYVKFNDGKAAKMFAKKPKAEGGNSNGSAPANSNAKAAPAAAQAPAQQPTRRPSGSAFGGRSK